MNNFEHKNQYRIYFAEFADGKKYIGQTKNMLESRINQHEQKAKDTRNTSKFYHALRTTKEPVIWGILERNISLDNVDERERYYINKYNTIDNGYNSVLGGITGYSNQFTKEQIKKIYKDLRANQLTLSDIADKNNTLLQTISGINKGDIYKLNGYTYPIRETYSQLTLLMVLDIANHLSLNLKETPAEYAKSLGIQRKKVQNINLGNSYRKYLSEHGYTEFPIWKSH